MKKLFIAIIIISASCFFFFTERDQPRDVDFQLSKNDLHELSNKEDVRINDGDLVTHMTKGALLFREMLNDRSYLNSKQDKIELCISIIEDRNLYHLHDLAGGELSSLLKKRRTVSYLQSRVSEKKLGYFLLRVNHSSGIPSGGSFFELDSGKKDELIRLLENPFINSDTKIYLIDAIYSLAFKAQSGDALHSAISNLEIDSYILDYNDDLFTIFRNLKPRYEKLEGISTWMEMDKNYDSIKSMMTDYHPMMFLQILCFNPSTLLESKELCLLKEKALGNIIAGATKSTYRDDYRLVYANELLIDGNYVTRFLDQLIARNEIPVYRAKLEDALIEMK